MADLPEKKAFFRIGEVSEIVGVEPHVLRYWEREFRTIRPTKSTKGQRIYSKKDVLTLLRVRDLLYNHGFTIAGAKKQLRRQSPPLPLGAANDTPPASGDEASEASEGTEPLAVLDLPPPELSQEIAVPEVESGTARRDRGDAETLYRTTLLELRDEIMSFLRDLEN